MNKKIYYKSTSKHLLKWQYKIPFTKIFQFKTYTTCNGGQKFFIYLIEKKIFFEGEKKTLYIYTCVCLSIYIYIYIYI